MTSVLPRSIEYKCSKCNVEGVKLWRQYNTFLDSLELMCKDCAEKDQDKKIEVDSDQIGNLIPAIPTKERDTFWGYTSVPMSFVIWWYGLPPEIPKKMHFPEVVTLNEDSINRDADADHYTHKLLRCAKQYVAIHKLGVSIDADGVAFKCEKPYLESARRIAEGELLSAAKQLFYELEIVKE